MAQRQLTLSKRNILWCSTYYKKHLPIIPTSDPFSSISTSSLILRIETPRVNVFPRIPKLQIPGITIWAKPCKNRSSLLSRLSQSLFQCQSMAIKSVLLVPMLIDVEQCWSMPIIMIIDWHWEELISIEKYFGSMPDFDRYWIALIGNDWASSVLSDQNEGVAAKALRIRDSYDAKIALWPVIQLLTRKL